MKLESLQQKLLAAARAETPSDHVPVAFEKRVLAHLTSSRPTEVSALWAQALWRAVVPCVAVALLVSAFSLATSPASESAAGETDLSQVFEQTLLAAADSAEDI
jgi:hypothetical protein